MKDSSFNFYKDLIKTATNKQDKFLKFFYSSRSNLAVTLHVTVYDSKTKSSFENICNTIPRSLCSRSTIKKILDEGVAQGFFEKKKNKIDNRIQLYGLSNHVQKSMHSWNKMMKDAFK